jgi:uncharacterized membrane protein
MTLKSFQISQFLVLNSLFCIAIYLLRVIATESLFYGFLLWNLFLAVIPYLISLGLSKTHWLKKQTLVLIGVLSIWLLFLPNAPYMITDLLHLRHAQSSLSWLDPFMLFVFAWNGLFLGLLSMHHVYVILSEKWNTKIAKRLLFVIAFLCGFGIYLGRYLRWNSWELFSDPIILLRDCFDSFYNPQYRMRTLGITLAFGVFLWILFLHLTSFFNIKKASQ